MASWPDDWQQKKSGDACPMCANSGKADRHYGSLIFEGRWSDAFLGRFPVRDGYVYVVWKGRHVAEPTELSAEEAAGFWSEVTRVAVVVERRYRPAKMNWLSLGNGVPHLHVHLVPRPFDDGSPGQPLGPDDFDWSYEHPLDDHALETEAAELRSALAASDPAG